LKKKAAVIKSKLGRQLSLDETVSYSEQSHSFVFRHQVEILEIQSVESRESVEEKSSVVIEQSQGCVLHTLQEPITLGCLQNCKETTTM
jgi:hypothetical protein